MRRRKHEEEPKLLSKKNLISLFIVVIMILSVAGFMISQNNYGSNDVVYGEQVFTFSQNTWVTEWEGRRLSFIFEPYTAEQVPVEEGAIEKLKGKPTFYFTYDDSSPYIQDMALVQFDYQRLLDENLGVYVERGMAFDNDYGVPLVTCGSATPTVPVLLFRAGNETSISLEGDCVIAEAAGQADVYLLGDRILYGLYGII